MDADAYNEPRTPIGDALPGMEIHALKDPADFVFVLARTKDADGSGWCYRRSAAPNREELLGALMIQAEILKREIAAEWEH